MKDERPQRDKDESAQTQQNNRNEHHGPLLGHLVDVGKVFSVVFEIAGVSLRVEKDRSQLNELRLFEFTIEFKLKHRCEVDVASTPISSDKRIVDVVTGNAVINKETGLRVPHFESDDGNKHGQSPFSWIGFGKEREREATI